MSEQGNQAHEIEQTSEQQSLKKLIQELNLPDEVIGAIEGLSKDKKEECMLMLEEIRGDFIGGLIKSPSDAADKAKNTLMDGFRIDVSKIDNSSNYGTIKALSEKNSISLEKLGKDINAVKSLDPIVGKELEKAKQENPSIPPELSKTIADKTGVTIENLDEIETKGGEKQQDVKNMIDAYYLANLDTTNIKEALKGKKSSDEIDKSFAELRNSARHLDIPVRETAGNIRKLLPDQTDKTQKLITDTVTSLTRNNPDTLITRTGDKLNWEGIDGRKYEIDMSEHPPRLTKSRNGLSISYETQPVNPELAESETTLKGARESLNYAHTNIHNKLHRAGAYINLGNYSTEQLEKAFSGNEFDQYEQKLRLAVTTAEQISLKTEIEDKIRKLSHTNSEGFLTKAGYEHIYNILQSRIALGDELGTRLAPSEDEKAFNIQFQHLKDIRTNGEIEKYVDERKKLEAAEKRLSSIKTPGVEDFDQNADATLSALIDLGYNELRQTGLDELIEAVNLKNKGTIKPIELNKEPTLDKAQLQSLRELAESLRKRSGQGELHIAMQQLHGGLTNATWREGHWKTIESRKDFLYPENETIENPPAK